MKIIYLCITVVVLSTLGIQAAQKRFMLEINNLTCQSLTNHTKQLTCGFIKVTNRRYLFNGKFMYDRKFGRESDLHLLIRITPWNGRKTFNFVDLKVNMCAITSEALRSILLRNLLNELIRSSNIPLDCSFKANYLYKMENYSLTDELIPAYAPYLNATFNVNFYRSSQLMGNIFVGVSLKPQKS